MRCSFFFFFYFFYFYYYFKILGNYLWQTPIVNFFIHACNTIYFPLWIFSSFVNDLQNYIWICYVFINGWISLEEMLQIVYSDPKFTYIHLNSDKSSCLISKAGEIIQYNGRTATWSSSIKRSHFLSLVLWGKTCVGFVNLTLTQNIIYI